MCKFRVREVWIVRIANHREFCEFQFHMIVNIPIGNMVKLVFYLISSPFHRVMPVLEFCVLYFAIFTYEIQFYIYITT